MSSLFASPFILSKSSALSNSAGDFPSLRWLLSGGRGLFSFGPPSLAAADDAFFIVLSPVGVPIGGGGGGGGACGAAALKVDGHCGGSCCGAGGGPGGGGGGGIEGGACANVLGIVDIGGGGGGIGLFIVSLKVQGRVGEMGAVLDVGKVAKGGGGGGGGGGRGPLWLLLFAVAVVPLKLVGMKVSGRVGDTGVLAVDGLDRGSVAKDGGGGGGGEGGGKGPLFGTGVDNGEGIVAAVACVTGLRPGVDVGGDGIGPLWLLDVGIESDEGTEFAIALKPGVVTGDGIGPL